MEIKGRNLVDGLPKDILIRSEEVPKRVCKDGPILYKEEIVW